MTDEQLDKLLEPVTWDWSSTIKYRRELVRSRRAAVIDCMDSMNARQIERAEAWLKSNTFHDLFNC